MYRSLSFGSDGNTIAVPGSGVYEYINNTWQSKGSLLPAIVNLSIIKISSDNNTVISYSEFNNEVKTFKWVNNAWISTGIITNDSLPIRQAELSRDGNTISVAYYEAENIYIYIWDGSSWVYNSIITYPIIYEVQSKLSPDGKTITIGGIFSTMLDEDGNIYVIPCNIKVYTRSDNNAVWVQKGSTIITDPELQYVDVSGDGNTIITGNDYRQYGAGKVILYKWDVNNWVKSTQEISTDIPSGLSSIYRLPVEIDSNGTTFVVGEYINKGPDTAVETRPRRGKLRVYTLQ